MLLVNFNADTTNTNMYSDERKDAMRIQRLVDLHDLILNSKPKRSTRPTWRKMIWIIDLTFTTPTIDALDT